MRFDTLTEWSNALDAAEARIAELEDAVHGWAISNHELRIENKSLEAERDQFESAYIARAKDVIRRLLPHVEYLSKLCAKRHDPEVECYSCLTRAPRIAAARYLLEIDDSTPNPKEDSP